jgi:hypothetical protein
MKISTVVEASPQRRHRCQTLFRAGFQVLLAKAGPKPRGRLIYAETVEIDEAFIATS